MAYEDQRDAREADVAGGDRRTAKRAEGSADPRHEPVDGFLRSKGIRFLDAAKVAWPPNLGGTGCTRSCSPASARWARLSGRAGSTGAGIAPSGGPASGTTTRA